MGTLMLLKLNTNEYGGWDKTKIIIFLLGENDDFLCIGNWFPFQGRFPRARLLTNMMLVRKTLSHDVTFFVFLPFHEGAKKMDFPLVLSPSGVVPPLQPIYKVSNF